MALMSKAAIVTGAAQGIGKAIAARLVKDGMRVAIVDINQEAAVAAAEELAGQYGADTMAVQCDVSQEEQVNIAVQKVLERFGTPNKALLAKRILLCSLFAGKETG